VDLATSAVALKLLEMKAIRSHIREGIAALLGAALGLPCAFYIWDRVVPPPRCDSTMFRGDRFVHLNCVSTGPPVWLMASSVIVGAILVLAIYRFIRSRRENTPGLKPGVSA
jgi:hypothetical protein